LGVEQQCLTAAGDLQVLAGPIVTGATALLFNRAAQAYNMTVSFAALAARFGARFPYQAGQAVAVRDLWRHEDLGRFADAFTAEAAPHALLRVNLALAAAFQAPHLVFVVLDDFGFNDLGAKSGGTVHSPALDALLADGVELTNYYVECVCSPSRATFLTGRSPLHHGVVDCSSPATPTACPPRSSRSRTASKPSATPVTPSVGRAGRKTERSSRARADFSIRVFKFSILHAFDSHFLFFLLLFFFLFVREMASWFLPRRSDADVPRFRQLRRLLRRRCEQAGVPSLVAERSRHAPAPAPQTPQGKTTSSTPRAAATTSGRT
jgi:hypothetical protein